MGTIMSEKLKNPERPSLARQVLDHAMLVGTLTVLFVFAKGTGLLDLLPEVVRFAVQRIFGV
jgi:hypothetical protein